MSGGGGTQYYFPRLSETGQRWVRFGLVVLAAAGVLWLAYVLRGVLTPLAVALAIAYILNPALGWFEKRNVRRLTSVSVLMVIVFGIAGLLLLAATVQVVEFSQRLPVYVTQTREWLVTTFPNLVREAGEAQDASSQPAATRPGMSAGLAEFAQTRGLSVAQAVAPAVMQTLSTTTYYLTILALIPIYTFFFMLHFNQIMETLRRHIPAEYRETILRVLATADRHIADFFRGRLLVAVLVGVISAVGWYIIGVPYSLIFGLISIPLGLVPFLGILVLPPVLLAAYVGAADGNWLWPVVAAFAVYMIVQALESFVIAPYIYSQSSGLHPVTTVVALMVGGEMAGTLGMLLSIPLASTLKSLGMEYLMPEIRRLAGIPPEPSELPPAPYNLGPAADEPEPPTAGPDESSKASRETPK